MPFIDSAKQRFLYGLIRITYNGHCCTLKENLIQFTMTLLNVTREPVENALITLKAKDEIIIEKREKEEWVYLYEYYKTEEGIANRIITLNNFKNIKYIKNIEKELKKAEEKIDIELSEKQKEAIKQVNENNVTIITGGPGTGKTTIIKTIIDIYEQRKNKVVLCAPTRTSCKKNDRNNRKRSLNIT